jgi:hypothetical protein
MVMNTGGLKTNNDCAGEDQQQFTCLSVCQALLVPQIWCLNERGGPFYKHIHGFRKNNNLVVGPENKNAGKTLRIT